MGVKLEGPRKPLHLPIRGTHPALQPPLALPALTRTKPGSGLKSDQRQDGLGSARKYIHFQENYTVV